MPPRTFVIDVGVQDELRSVRKTMSDFDMNEVAGIMDRAPVTDEVIRHWQEKAGDRQSAKRSGSAAATTGGGTAAGTGTLTQADAASWDWTSWLTIGLVGLGVVALTLALVWAWRRHGERAKAYAAALAGELETDLTVLIGNIKEAAQ